MQLHGPVLCGQLLSQSPHQHHPGFCQKASVSPLPCILPGLQLLGLQFPGLCVPACPQLALLWLLWAIISLVSGCTSQLLENYL